MAETSKNKIYYNDDENSVADVLTDMKKMAESTDEAIEKSKYNDAAIKKSISDVEKNQVEKNIEQDSKIVELQTEKAKLEKELKEAQEDFYQNSIRGQASGEYIHVEDSSNCRARIGISGNSVQKIREGDNVLKQKNISDFSKNGVDIAYNSDGTIYVFGTASDVVDIKLCGLWASTEVQFSLKAGQYKYTSNNSGVSLCLVNNTSPKKVKDNAILTLTEDYDVTDAFIRIESGKTVDVIIKPMLYLYQGIEREYEQYGVSPSPEYPSEVESCGDNVNLFDLETWFNTVGSKDCTATLIKNGVKLDFVAGADVYLGDVVAPNVQLQESKRNSCIKVKPNTTYTIQMSSAPKCYISYLDSNYTGTRAYTAIYNNYSKYIMTFTTNETTEYIHIRLGLGSSYGGTTYTFTDIKLEEGTTPTPYTPYGQGCINEVICNKNLFDKNNVINDKFMANILTTNTDWCYNISKSFKAGETYITSGGRCILGYFNGDTNISYKDITNTTITIPEGTTKVYISTLKTNLDTLQIEEGTKATEKVEHQEQVFTIPTQQPMRAIGDVRDTFIKKNNKWYERHYINRLILNGTESWKISTDTKFFFVTNIISSTDYSKVYCNIALSASSYAELTDGTARVAIRNDGNGIYISNTNSMTLADWKAWLSAQYEAGTPVYVDYILETPNDIECTEEQSKILEELNNARTYKNVTNITTDSKAILSLDYVKDQETQNQKMQNEIDEIKQLLSTTQTSAMLLDNLQKEVESEVE